MAKKKERNAFILLQFPRLVYSVHVARLSFFFLYYAVFFFLSFRHVLMTGANCLAQKQVANNVLRKNTCKKTPVRIFICVMSARTTNSCCRLVGKRYYVTAKRVRCTASTKFQETTSYPMTTLCVLRGPQINK